MALNSQVILEPRSAADYHAGRLRYWEVVLPLTLLTAYLLLSKPRPRKPQEATKPPDEAQVIHA